MIPPISLSKLRKAVSEGLEDKTRPVPHWIVPLRNTILDLLTIKRYHRSRKWRLALLFVITVLGVIFAISGGKSSIPSEAVEEEVVKPKAPGRHKNRHKQSLKEQERVVPKKLIRDLEMRKEREAMLKPYMPASENVTATTGSGGRFLELPSPSSPLGPRLHAPEFVFGGEWRSTREEAGLSEEDTPAPFSHAGSILAVSGGQILAAWFSGAYEGMEDTAIYSAIREPERNWQSPKLVVKVHRDVPYAGKKKNGVSNGGEPHWNPVLFCGNPLGVCDSTILLFFKIGWKVSDWQTFVTESEDFGSTWGPARELVPGDLGGRGPVKNKPIILTDGSWLAGGSLEGAAQAKAFADRSTDLGLTWIRSEDIAPKDLMVGVSLPTVWESEPGIVHMLLHSHQFSNLMRAKSRDGGRTWSLPRKTTIPNNNAGIDIARMPYSGDLILAHVPTTSSKSPLRLAISQDNGLTWPLVWDVETQRSKSGDKRGSIEFSYPSIIPWPQSIESSSSEGSVSIEEGFALIYTWHRQRMAFLSMSLDDLKAKCKPNHAAVKQ